MATDDLAVLVVDDDAQLRAALGAQLREDGYRIAEAGTADEAVQAIAQRRYDAAVVDVMLGADDGFGVMERLKAAAPHLEVVLATGMPSVQAAVLAMSRGAFQYVAKPFNHGELRLLVERAARKARDASDKEALLERERRQADRRLVDGVVAESPAMKAALAEAREIAALDQPVFIHGETGTGKELIAGLIHRASPRCDGPFSAVNCGSLAENLVDAELFGHEKGAFTGADRARLGVIPSSEDGTLFLDEIGDIPEAAQVRLLRFLENGMVRPLGGSRERRIDVRIVAASHKDLAREVEAGRFRRDLYHRLAVFEVRLPPLRQRPEDVAPIAALMLRRLDRGGDWKVGEDALALLRAQPWLGNVRELRNEVERAWLRARRRGSFVIEARDFAFAAAPAEAVAVAGHAPEVRAAAAAVHGEAGYGLVSLADAEHLHVRDVVARCDGNRRKAAAILGVSERHLYRLLRERDEPG